MIKRKVQKRKRNPESLKKELNNLRPKIIEIAQKIYDEWEEDEFEGGICDLIADQISSLIDNEISDIEINEGGHGGDDHAWIIVEKNNKKYGVDIPSDIYEKGGGYN